MATSYIIKSEGSQLNGDSNLGDWNNAVPGDLFRFAFYSGASWANSAPDMLFAIVMKYDENNIVQIGSGPSGVFYRKRSFGTWSAWGKLGGVLKALYFKAFRPLEGWCLA